MIRNILAVIGGYVAMAVIVIAFFSLAFVAPRFAFERGALTTTLTWNVLSLIVSFVAAVVGGAVTALIALRKSWVPVVTLATLMIVLGLAGAVGNLLREPPPSDLSADDVEQMSIEERTRHGSQPVWYAFLLPVIGSVGAMTGGQLAMRRP